jgi:type IV secretion system protein TrbD
MSVFSDLRLTPFYRALHRPNLFLGGEREPVMCIGIISGGLIISSQNWPATVVGLCVWFLSLAIFRLMGKIDPYLVRVYLRHLKYQNYYAPRSTPWRQD